MRLLCWMCWGWLIGNVCGLGWLRLWFVGVGSGPSLMRSLICTFRLVSAFLSMFVPMTLILSGFAMTWLLLLLRTIFLPFDSSLGRLWIRWAVMGRVVVSLRFRLWTGCSRRLFLSGC